MLAYTGHRPVLAGRFIAPCPPDEPNQGIVRLGDQKMKLAGNIAITSNGAYAITTPLAAAQNGFHVVTPLPSGTSTVVAGAFNGSSQRMTDDATVLSPETTAITLADRNGFTRVLQTQHPISEALIDRSGKTIFYVKPSIGPYDVAASLSAIDVATGHETLLAQALYVFSPSATADGSTILVGLAVNGSNQLFLTGLTSGGVMTKVTNESDGIVSAVISGDGRVAYAVTGGSRLLRIDVPSGTVTELAPSTPQVAGVYLNGVVAGQPLTDAAVGSVLDLVVSGTITEADFCGHPGTIVPGSGLRIQMPFDVPIGKCRVIVRSNSPFENAFDLQIVQYDPHFTGFPTSFAGTALPGQTIVVYMVGLGAVDSDHQVAQGFGCTFDSVPAAIPYAGLAPGIPGVYQINITVPNLSPRDASLVCGWSGGYTDSTSVRLGPP